MPRKKKDDKTPPLSDPIPVRLKIETLDSAGLAMKQTGRSQQEVLRLASEIGLAALAMVDYDVPSIVAKFALEKADEQRLTVPGSGKLMQTVPKKFKTDSSHASSAVSG